MCIVSHSSPASSCETRRRRRCLHFRWKRFHDDDVNDASAAWRTRLEAGFLRQVLPASRGRASHAHQETAAVRRRDRGMKRHHTYEFMFSSVLRKNSFSQRIINDWNELDSRPICLNAVQF